MPKKKSGLFGLVLGVAAAVGAAVFLSKKENRQKVARVAKKAGTRAKSAAKKARTSVKKAKTKARKVARKRK